MLTLKKLKSMVGVAPHSQKGMPSIKRLEEEGAKVVVREVVSDMELTVYQNGYVSGRRGRSETVFRLHDCGNYTYDTVRDMGSSSLPGEVFLEEAWYIRLYLEAEDRLNANYERMLRRHHFSLDAIFEEYCPAMGDFTWEGQTELLGKEDMKQFYKFLEMMTKKQQRLVILYFVDQKSMKDIAAELGVTRQAASDMMKKAINRVRKKQGLDAAGIARGIYNRSEGEEENE